MCRTVRRSPPNAPVLEERQLIWAAHWTQRGAYSVIEPRCQIQPCRQLETLGTQGVPADSLFALIDLVTPDQATEYWIGLQNFYVITRYNRSSFYAMSVMQLAEAIRKARAKP